MADITRVLFVRHIRADANAFILHYKGARLVEIADGPPLRVRRVSGTAPAAPTTAQPARARESACGRRVTVVIRTSP